MPDQRGHNLIWGWGGIAKATQGSSKYEETFYQARLKLAEARFLFAMKWTEADKRVEIFKLGQARFVDDLSRSIPLWAAPTRRRSTTSC